MKLMTIWISRFANPFVEGSQIQAGEWMRTGTHEREGYEINFCFLQAPRALWIKKRGLEESFHL